jgi:hypothetical protein
MAIKQRPLWRLDRGRRRNNRQAKRRSRWQYFRTTSLESLEPRWLLTSTLDLERVSSIDETDDYVDGHVLITLRTPYEINDPSTLTHFLANQTWPEGVGNAIDKF